MNYIYDIVLCFNNYDLNIDFYEWNKSDNFSYIGYYFTHEMPPVCHFSF